MSSLRLTAILACLLGNCCNPVIVAAKSEWKVNKSAAGTIHTLIVDGKERYLINATSCRVHEKQSDGKTQELEPSKAPPAVKAKLNSLGVPVVEWNGEWRRVSLAERRLTFHKTTGEVKELLAGKWIELDGAGAPKKLREIMEAQYVLVTYRSKLDKDPDLRRALVKDDEFRYHTKTAAVEKLVDKKWTKLAEKDVPSLLRGQFARMGVKRPSAASTASRSPAPTTTSRPTTTPANSSGRSAASSTRPSPTRAAPAPPKDTSGYGIPADVLKRQEKIGEPTAAETINDILKKSKLEMTWQSRTGTGSQLGGFKWSESTTFRQDASYSAGVLTIHQSWSDSGAPQTLEIPMSKINPDRMKLIEQPSYRLFAKGNWAKDDVTTITNSRYDLLLNATDEQNVITYRLGSDPPRMYISCTLYVVDKDKANSLRAALAHLMRLHGSKGELFPASK